MPFFFWILFIQGPKGTVNLSEKPLLEKHFLKKGIVQALMIYLRFLPHLDFLMFISQQDQIVEEKNENNHFRIEHFPNISVASFRTFSPFYTDLFWKIWLLGLFLNICLYLHILWDTMMGDKFWGSEDLSTLYHISKIAII